MLSTTKKVIFVSLLAGFLYLPSATATHGVFHFFPEIDPAFPEEGQEMTLTLFMPSCFRWGEFPNGEKHHLDRQEQTLHFYLPSAGPGLCGTFPPPAPVDFTLGAFEAGTHTVHIFIIPEDAEFPVDPENLEVSDTLSFGVSQGPPLPIPVLTPWGLTLLTAVFMLLAFRAMRRFQPA